MLENNRTLAISLLGMCLKTHTMWAEWAYAKVKIYALLKAMRFFSAAESQGTLRQKFKNTIIGTDTSIFFKLFFSRFQNML